MLVYVGLEQGAECNPLLQVSFIKGIMWLCFISCLCTSVFFFSSFRPGVIKSEQEMIDEKIKYQELNKELVRKIQKL